MTALGRLERVDLRAAWLHEALEFTPWLASPENISLLSETLGFGPDGLEVDSVERRVGPFRADILARDAVSDGTALIETPLEKSDHRHLGQILTHAAGVRARSVVRVAARMQDEQKAAVAWLNEASSVDHAFRILSLPDPEAGAAPAPTTAGPTTTAPMTEDAR
ncbi:MAG: hypothetical protein VYD87_21120 [Pseudomonadota bacterium]|nr:hypothetical protein [Pseudomonadota bacterium]